MLGLSKMCNCDFAYSMQISMNWGGKPFLSGSHNVKHSCFTSLFSVQYQSQFGMNVVISLATQKVKSLFQSRAFRMKTFSVHCIPEGITAIVKPSVWHPSFSTMPWKIGNHFCKESVTEPGYKIHWREMQMAANVQEQKEKRPIHFYETRWWFMVWHTIGTAKE